LLVGEYVVVVHAGRKRVFAGISYPAPGNDRHEVSLLSLSTVHFSDALRARERAWALAPWLLSVVKLCFFMPVWERGKAGASTVLSRILLRREFLQVVREMCAASWRDRLYSECWALECLHQVYRAAVEFLAHAPRDAQKVLPPVLDDLIIALRSASP
jgi:hypothetical protein